jgi:hypothetical protein
MKLTTGVLRSAEAGVQPFSGIDSISTMVAQAVAVVDMN